MRRLLILIMLITSIAGAIMPASASFVDTVVSNNLNLGINNAAVVVTQVTIGVSVLNTAIDGTAGTIDVAQIAVAIVDQTTGQTIVNLV
jgi:hypothetical protein